MTVAETGAAERGHGPAGSLIDYLRPFRFDHWIKNLVVPIGSVLALVAHRTPLTGHVIGEMALIFFLSGLVSSVNYVINEILDARFDATHPVKRQRPIPSGRVRPGPLLVLAVLVALGTFAATGWLFSTHVEVATLALLVAGLLYNLPPLRLKDWPYADVITESVTNPIRLNIGWLAVAGASAPPLALLLGAWAFGAFLMTGKRLAELRALGPAAARYRETFRAYTVRSLFVAQALHACFTLAAMAVLFATHDTDLLVTLPAFAAVLVWTFKMTFEPNSPLVDPEHLYRRPLFLFAMLLTFSAVIIIALV